MRSLFVCAVLAALASPAVAKPPNVVLILTDDMGYADLGCYGCKDIKTPNVDKLAKQGTRLTHFYSNGPVCTPTRAALMTGRWQQRVGLEWAIYPGQKKPGLTQSETTVAKLLKDAGYRTAIFGKWHLGYQKEYAPNAHGFEKFVGLLSGNVDHYSKKENTGELDWYEDTTAKEEKRYSTDVITERTVDFIEKNAKSTFFLYVPYNAVHWPFQPPDKPSDVRDKSTWLNGTRKDYAAMLERVDAGVGKILAALDKHKLADDTLVVFTNDNGGERLSDNGPLFHRKATVWEGGIRVPCILRWPGKVAADAVSEQPAISMDLTATILAAAGVKPAKDRPLDGIDLLPVLKEGKMVERTFYWRIDRDDRKQKAVRHGDWKYVRDGGIELLFDLAKDQGERKDVSYRHPEVVKLLRAKLAAWEKEMAKHKPEHVVK
jgi:arylsulfatase A-like enzyme